jgi:LmbE family N-acetylglucosaminyl deacetylase
MSRKINQRPKQKPIQKLKHTRKPKGLIVSAHPDDESIFFAGLILSQKYQWDVVCVTDGNADGLGAMRQTQFQQACKILGAKNASCWEFPDIFEKRLDVSALQSRLAHMGDYKAVFTHGILGEYGHPHHQDVSFAVHEALAPSTAVYSVAYNIHPQLRVILNDVDFKTKTKVLWDIYSGEIRRFVQFLPATFDEGFTKVSSDEVRAIYQTLTKGTELDVREIKHYRWLIPYLKAGGGMLRQRPF